MTKVLTKVFRNLKVHEVEVKNQSNLSKSGGNCLFVQVNCLPCSGNSIKPKLLMASLNKNISLGLALPYSCPQVF